VFMELISDKKSSLEKLDLVMTMVRREVESASSKFPPFHSTHEGYAVILEELDEMWEEIRVGNIALAKSEAIQVAAMAVRFLVDL
jgi:archaellum component FlaC